jgi:hypothetical protein
VETVVAKNVVLMRPERAHERLVLLMHGRVAAVWDPASFQPYKDAAAALAAKRDDAVRGNSYRPRTARAASLHTQEGATAGKVLRAMLPLATLERGDHLGCANAADANVPTETCDRLISLPRPPACCRLSPTPWFRVGVAPAVVACEGTAHVEGTWHGSCSAMIWHRFCRPLPRQPMPTPSPTCVERVLSARHGCQVKKEMGGE